MLLNMFSYTSFLMSVFVSLLATYLRMIACVYPFKLSKISLPQPILAILIFLCVSFGISYIPYSGIIFSHIDEPQLTLGLGLILPIMKHGHYTWSLLGYVSPCGRYALYVLCTPAYVHTCAYSAIKNVEPMFNDPTT